MRNKSSSRLRIHSKKLLEMPRLDIANGNQNETERQAEIRADRLARNTDEILESLKRIHKEGQDRRDDFDLQKWELEKQQRDALYDDTSRKATRDALSNIIAKGDVLPIPAVVRLLEEVKKINADTGGADPTPFIPTHRELDFRRELGNRGMGFEHQSFLTDEFVKSAIEAYETVQNMAMENEEDRTRKLAQIHKDVLGEVHRRALHKALDPSKWLSEVNQARLSGIESAFDTFRTDNKGLLEAIGLDEMFNLGKEITDTFKSAVTFSGNMVDSIFKSKLIGKDAAEIMGGAEGDGSVLGLLREKKGGKEEKKQTKALKNIERNFGVVGRKIWEESRDWAKSSDGVLRSIDNWLKLDFLAERRAEALARQREPNRRAETEETDINITNVEPKKKGFLSGVLTVVSAALLMVKLYVMKLASNFFKDMRKILFTQLRQFFTTQFKKFFAKMGRGVVTWFKSLGPLFKNFASLKRILPVLKFGLKRLLAPLMVIVDAVNILRQPIQYWQKYAEGATKMGDMVSNWAEKHLGWLGKFEGFWSGVGEVLNGLSKPLGAIGMWIKTAVGAWRDFFNWIKRFRIFGGRGQDHGDNSVVDLKDAGAAESRAVKYLRSQGKGPDEIKSRLAELDAQRARMEERGLSQGAFSPLRAIKDAEKGVGEEATIRAMNELKVFMNQMFHSPQTGNASDFNLRGRSPIQPPITSTSPGRSGGGGGTQTTLSTSDDDVLTAMLNYGALA